MARLLLPLLGLALAARVQIDSDGAEELQNALESVSELEKPVGAELDFTAVDNMKRVHTDIVLEGNVSEVTTWQSVAGSWWVVKWHDKKLQTSSAIIKMWNGEIDMTTNKQWYKMKMPKRMPRTSVEGFDDDIEYSLDQGRYKVTNFAQLKPDIVNTNFKLKLRFVTIGKPAAGNCYNNAKYTMKRAIKGWYGLYKERHLALQNATSDDDGTYSDEDESDGADVVGLAGARSFNTVLRMWSLIRDLEALYASWLVRAKGDDLKDALDRCKGRIADIEELLRDMQDKDHKDAFTKLLNDWKASLTKEGAERAILESVRRSPIPGSAVRQADGSVVRCSNIYPGKSLSDFIIEVQSKSGSRKNISHSSWKQLKEVLHSDVEFGWMPGGEVIRYGGAFKVLSIPNRSSDAPIEGSQWAEIQLSDGETEAEFGMVNPHCKDHPLIGKTFRLRQRKRDMIRGAVWMGSDDKNFHNFVYKIISVGVVHEGKKIVMLDVERLDDWDEHTAASSISSLYNSTLLKSLVWNRQLRTSPKGQKTTAVLAFSHWNARTDIFNIKEVKPFRRFTMGLVDAKTKAHYGLVAERVSGLLRIAIQHVWAPPDYNSDDRSKVVAFQMEIALNTITALIALGITVSVVGILVTALPVLFTYGLGMTWAVLQPSIWMMLAGQVFANAINMMPKGIPNQLYQGVRESYLASILAYDSMLYAEKIGSVSLGTELCPMGSGLKPEDFKKFGNTSDQHSIDDFATKEEKMALAAGEQVMASSRFAMCRRHQLRESDRKKMHHDEQEKRTMQGKAGRMYNPFERDGKMTGWFHKQTLEAKAMRRYETAIYMMEQLGKALSHVSAMECEVVADPNSQQKYRMRNLYSIMPRPENDME